MVESTSTYFEAYKHVLESLQRVEVTKFPFAQYLIEASEEVLPPNYLSKYNNTYNLDSVFSGGTTKFPILGKWPTRKQEGSDQPQGTFPKKYKYSKIIFKFTL